MTELPVPTRDPITKHLTRPLDYADAFRLHSKQNEREEAHPLRIGASELGLCLRRAVYKRTDTPMDAGKEGFDQGIAERGHAVEARFLHILREVHGENVVLQDVPLHRAIIMKDPREEGKEVIIWIGTQSDPLVIGPDLQILTLYEVKSKDNKYFFAEVQQKWTDEKKYDPNEITKVPLLLFGVEEGGDKGASTHNLIQLATEARILRDEGRKPAQTILTYIYPGTLNVHLSAVLSDTDINVLSELAFLWTKQFYHYFLRGEIPPPWFTMGWECGLCDYQKTCADRIKKDGVERTMNVIFRDLNKRLDAARKAKVPQSLADDRTRFANARDALRISEEIYTESLVKDLPLPGYEPKKGAK